MRFVDSLAIHASTKYVMSRTLNRSSAIWRFKHSNAIEIHDGNTGLPHIDINTYTEVL